MGKQMQHNCLPCSFKCSNGSLKCLMIAGLCPAGALQEFVNVLRWATNRWWTCTKTQLPNWPNPLLPVQVSRDTTLPDSTTNACYKKIKHTLTNRLPHIHSFLHHLFDLWQSKCNITVSGLSSKLGSATCNNYVLLTIYHVCTWGGKTCSPQFGLP